MKKVLVEWVIPIIVGFPFYYCMNIVVVDTLPKWLVTWLGISFWAAVFKFFGGVK